MYIGVVWYSRSAPRIEYGAQSSCSVRLKIVILLDKNHSHIGLQEPQSTGQHVFNWDFRSIHDSERRSSTSLSK